MNLLLVDDNPDYLYPMAKILSEKGYDVHTAEDGIKGCEVLTTQNIDLIISDVAMPKFDGIMLHDFARSLDAYKHTRFVFVSSMREAYEEDIHMNPELDFFLEKVGSSQEIISFVDHLIARSAAEATSQNN